MSNQQKNIGLLIGFFIALFIVYKFAIQKTIDSKKLYTTLLQEKELLDNASSKILSLQQHNIYLDSILNANNLSIENSFQQTLLERISGYAKQKKLQIISFHNPHEIKKDGTTVLTYSFEVKGDFISLLSLTHYIDQQSLGELISVHFKKKKNYKTNQRFVSCVLFLQRMKK